MPCRFTVLAIALCLPLAAQQQIAGEKAFKPATEPAIRGITISTHGLGRDWGSDRIVPCIRDIKAVGANWIAIHPYARIHRSGRVTWSSWDPALGREE